MLNDAQIERVKAVIGMDGWREIMQPIYGQRGQAALKALVMSQSQRSGEYEGESDDVIRGRIKEIEWTLVAWNHQIVNHEINRRQDEARENGAEVPQG